MAAAGTDTPRLAAPRPAPLVPADALAVPPRLAADAGARVAPAGGSLTPLSFSFRPAVGATAAGFPAPGLVPTDRPTNPNAGRGDAADDDDNDAADDAAAGAAERGPGVCLRRTAAPPLCIARTVAATHRDATAPRRG